MKRIRYCMLAISPLVLVFAMWGCGSTGIGGGDFNLISIEQEWEMGQQLEAEIAREMQLVNDPAVLNYVNQIGQRLVQQTTYKNLPWEFHVVADGSVNAFNIPGGHVYVHTGLIQEADNASELISVMSHEIAHGLERHATERLTKAYGVSIIAGLVLGRDPGLLQQIVAQIVATGAIAKFSRDDEREADNIGVRLMYEIGYNPQGMVTMFQSLLAERQRRPSSVEQFFSTHPLSEERIENVRQQISQLPSKQGLITNDNGFQSLRQRVAAYGG